MCGKKKIRVIGGEVEVGEEVSIHCYGKVVSIDSLRGQLRVFVEMYDDEAKLSRIAPFPADRLTKLEEPK